MKEYYLTVEINKWKHFQKLDPQYRTTTKIAYHDCKDMADLMNCYAGFLKSWEGFFPTVISIEER